MRHHIFIVITASSKRTHWLLQRSLPSVYKQQGIDSEKSKVIIVDDNRDENEKFKIESGIKELRCSLGLRPEDFPTRIIRNIRTRFRSGTGAWNTGIYMAYQEQPKSFVAILDDDDKYMPTHLADCLEQINRQPHAEAVFQELVWRNPDGSVWNFPLTPDDIHPRSFYIANPGVQGSNLFVLSRALVECGAFDENFESTTDRDLMIRLLWYWMKLYPSQWRQMFSIISKPAVVHYAHINGRVTTDPQKKRKGLDRFYQKYLSSFSESDHQQSLNRAKLLFQYPGYKSSHQSIVLLMAMHNNGDTVEQAIGSVLDQKATKRPLYILVSDDNSSDEGPEIVEKLASSFPNIRLYRNSFKSASRNRNWLQEKVRKLFPGCLITGRLDADDSLAENDILQRTENFWEETRFDVLLMANHQYSGNSFTGYTNRPDESLKKPEALLERLRKMADGVWEAELPSCNVFLRPEVVIPFAEKISAEDHRNLVEYLLKSDELNIKIKPEWVYCNYRIDKHLNAKSKEKKDKRKARKELYNYAQDQISARQRNQKAETILNNWKPGCYKYLGSGFSGVVFHDEAWVYKVHLPLSTNNFSEIDNILFLKAKLDIFSNRKHFYPLKEITSVNDVYILVYPFEESESVSKLGREDMISFLAEMWQMKVICRSITKENNFRRVNGVIKLIDYEIEPYNDNLFLNVSARAFIQLDDFKYPSVSYHKLKRSTINHFNLPELEGFYGFTEEIFQRCASASLQPNSVCSVEVPMKNCQGRPAHAVYDGVDNPSVSLLIKACVQDSATLREDVGFLVGQLTREVQFANRVLLLDVYKSTNFLRQYSHQGNKDELLSKAEQLKHEGIIDQIIIPPGEPESIAQINAAWFGQTASSTHTVKGVPITSQIYAFEQMQGDFVLQMDVDVIIGHKNQPGDYLMGMVAALQEHPNAISIGYQIYHEDSLTSQPIFGIDGSIPPDVRCCLLHKNRLLEARPIPNACRESGWELSWYRALEEYQKQKGLASLRGGPSESFYMHIQNYRKTNRWVWHTIQQGVKYGLMPKQQEGQPEVAGDIFDWCLPKRSEDLIVILYLDTLHSQSLQQTLRTLESQDLKDWGLVIVNNTGQPDFTSSIRRKNWKVKDHITFIDLEQPLPYNEGIYKAIHYYLCDPDSFICLLRQGDILLYSGVLSECMNRLHIYSADVLIGKEISERTLSNAGLSRSNFVHSRQEPETLANGLAIFRKYLFDALSHLELKEKNPDAKQHLAGYSRITRTFHWLNDPSNISLLTPIIELSHNPIRFDHFNVLRKQHTSESETNAAIEFVQQQAPKTEGVWEKGRKTFLPNQQRIELDITYDCNLKCFHCNRSCTQAPSQAQMTMEQIRQFVQESIAHGKQWQLINVLGGEPTMHQQFEAIVHCLLYEYIIPHSPKTTLQITSNGYGDEVMKKLNALPAHPNLVVDDSSFKDGRAVSHFTPFNLAPADEPDTNQHEYHKGCWVTSYCGIGLNHLGYFACGVAGGIERVLKAGQCIISLESLNEYLLQQQLNTYCRLCGNFTVYASNRGDFMERAEKDSAPTTAISKTWIKIYNSHNHANS